MYATQVTLPDQTKDYVGLPSGYQTLPSITASGLNQEMAKAPMKLAMMPYAEVEFIKAELLKKRSDRRRKQRCQRGLSEGSAGGYRTVGTENA